MEDFKRCLANSPEPWLLILDNADDPLLNISKFFPVGIRGTIIITSRNPECRCHATVGSTELHEMESDDAITLLLKSAELSVDDDNLRGAAKPIVQTLGYLALAVSQAAASIRQRVCSLDDYLEVFKHNRRKLLSRESVQSSFGYQYTVYTTWSISVDAIKNLAKDPTDRLATTALEFLTFFGFCHFDGITERIFQSAWDNFDDIEEYQWWASNQLSMVRDRQSSSWDSLRFKEAMQLLSSYSLIRVSGSDSRISLHPLVHSWIRDSLNEELRLQWWNVALSTLALVSDLRWSYNSPVQHQVHFKHCMDVRQIDDFLIEDDVPLDRLKILDCLVSLCSEYPWRDALIISERGLEYSKRTLGDKCYFTCQLSRRLAQVFNGLGEYQKTLDLLHGMVDVSIRLPGHADELTLAIMGLLALANRRLGREQEALELNQKMLAFWKKSLDRSDYISKVIAMAYVDLDRSEDAIHMLEREIARRLERLGERYVAVARLEYLLACAFASSGRHQAAIDSFHNSLKGSQKVNGEDHPITLKIMVDTALEYTFVSQPEKGIPLIIKALEVGSKFGYDERLKEWEEDLSRLQHLSAERSSHVSKKLSKSQKQPRPAAEEISSGKKSRFWQRLRNRIGEISFEEAESSKGFSIRQRRT